MDMGIVLINRAWDNYMSHISENRNNLAVAADARAA
jgi:hypothetical protein